MKISYFFLLFSIIHLYSNGQQTSSVILTESQAKTIFSDQVKKELSINYPIFKVYEYTDKLGKHYYLVLTEKRI